MYKNIGEYEQRIIYENLKQYIKAKLYIKAKRRLKHGNLETKEFINSIISSLTLGIAQKVITEDLIGLIGKYINLSFEDMKYDSIMKNIKEIGIKEFHELQYRERTNIYTDLCTHIDNMAKDIANERYENEQEVYSIYDLEYINDEIYGSFYESAYENINYVIFTFRRNKIADKILKKMYELCDDIDIPAYCAEGIFCRVGKQYSYLAVSVEYLSYNTLSLITLTLLYMIGNGDANV